MSNPITVQRSIWKGIVFWQSVPTDHECVLLWSWDERPTLDFCLIEFQVLANQNCNSCAILCSVPKSSSEEFISKIILSIWHG